MFLTTSPTPLDPFSLKPKSLSHLLAFTLRTARSETDSSVGDCISLSAYERICSCQASGLFHIGTNPELQILVSRWDSALPQGRCRHGAPQTQRKSEYPSIPWAEFERMTQVRMPCSRTWCREALVRTDVSEECITSIVSVKRISEIGTTLAVTN
jgi:hypothetical protein